MENCIKNWNDEPYNVAKDATNLCLIQQSLDANMFYVIFETNIAKEAWGRLKRVSDVSGWYIVIS